MRISTIRHPRHFNQPLFTFLLFITAFGQPACSKIDGMPDAAIVNDIDETLPAVINQTVGTEMGDSQLFGAEVAIDGNYAIVSDAGYSFIGKSRVGRASIFKRNASNQWTRTASFTHSHTKANDNFTRCVAISGNYAVCATNDSIYVFQRILGESWVQQSAFAPSNAGPDGLRLGAKGVAIDGDYIVLGDASRTEAGKYLMGAAYFFKRQGSNWVQIGSVFSPNNQAYDRFGMSVAIHGNYAIVGAEGSLQGSHGGKAYVYYRAFNTWLLQATLQETDIILGDQYGRKVEIRGNLAIVGAPAEGVSNGNPGAAYIYQRTGSAWTKIVRLTSPDGNANRDFGRAVAISSTNAFISGDVGGAQSRGSVYRYVRLASNWIYVGKDSNPTPAPSSDDFGWSVAADSTRHYVVGNFGYVSFGTTH